VRVASPPDPHKSDLLAKLAFDEAVRGVGAAGLQDKRGNPCGHADLGGCHRHAIGLFVTGTCAAATLHPGVARLLSASSRRKRRVMMNRAPDGAV